ncbi:helix-turn-helix transcriptional regulator [Plebeiibacterium sediminum]|uniref:AraC family transcriptional regulator n=1 Tax=Plebeiibacterium sediminum TaxID=2992112 RepID=A0AAE3M642_9BACT|nr:AraC family transcriptional regulator [Plebeiobacterium sediminum]MCW3787874.1 AraC family transcriptional regulator [Plebeiobacterium sediminum]
MEQKKIFLKTTDIEYLTLKTHKHTYHHQLIYMIKGTSHVKVDTTEFFLPEGFIGLIPKGHIHNIYSRNEKVKMFLIYFPSDIHFEQYISLNSNDFIIENIRYISKQNHIVDPATDVIFYKFIDSFLGLIINSKQQYSLPVKGLIEPKNERLALVLNYLKSNFKEDITLLKVADEFGFTIRNLTRLFKKENISFVNYLNYLRIIHAIELFSEHRDNIADVAFEVGYNSASNFSRTFKKYTGYTPRDFINENATNSILK